jgi:hypothetical protein
MLLCLSWKLVSKIFQTSPDFLGLIRSALGFAVTAVVALILNLSLPYDIEEDTEVLPENEAQLATFTEAGSSKETPEVVEKKVDELSV